MGLIPNDVINQVIERSDIVETIGNYVLLKKAGRNFKALCPFHNEKSASFVVNPDKQIFHCFGCAAGGNVIGFIMRQEHLEFPEAVRFLAAKAGVVIPEADADVASPTRQLREDVYKVNQLAVDFFHDILLTSRADSAKAAREYLKARGVELEVVKKFQLGFAPDEWDALLKFLKSKNISEELMFKAGLIIARENKSGHYDRFRNRVIFPIFDIQSRPVAFGARAMKDSDGAKYINSPETPVYTKGQHLFGFNLTKTASGKLDQVIVVEGYMDMIMPFVHGVDNIAASLGTALTVEQIRLIRRYTPNVVMLFDTDPAGQSAIIRSLDLLIEEGMRTRVVTLADGEDPDSFIRSHGVEQFQGRLAQAQSLFDYKIDWLKGQHNVDTVEGKSQICQHMLATIAKFKDEVVKYELTKELGVRFNLPEGVLLKQAQQGKSPKAPVVENVAPLKVSSNFKAAEELLLTLFLTDPDWVRLATGQVSPDDFSVSTRGIVAEILALSQGSAPWSVNDVLLRLSDAGSQSLVTQLLSQDESKLGDKARVFQDCVAHLRKERQKKMRSQMMDAIRQAEAKGDEAVLDRLKNEFNQLLKS